MDKNSPTPISKQVKTQALDNKKPNMLFIVIVVAIVAAGLGYGLGSIKKGGIASLGTDSKLREEVERAKKFFPQIDDIRIISGTVTAVGGSSFTIKADSLPNPFDEAPEMREVLVNDSTTFFIQKPKNPDLYNQEFAIYLKNTQKEFTPGEALYPPPTPYSEEKTSLGEIKIGDRVSVEASENIKTLQQFTASRITLQ